MVKNRMVFGNNLAELVENANEYENRGMIMFHWVLDTDGFSYFRACTAETSPDFQSTGNPTYYTYSGDLYISNKQEDIEVQA